MQEKDDIEKLMEVSNMMAQMKQELDECQVQLNSIENTFNKIMK